MKKWKEKLILKAELFDFPIHTPYFQLTDEQRKLLWKGNRSFRGINRFFDHLEEKKYKIQYRVMLSRYRGKTLCPECHGSRLRREASYVKVGGKTISELVSIPISHLQAFFAQLKITKKELKVYERLLKEINSRLGFMTSVGLGYLTLNRLSSTLSGGESQRINLATSLGSSLVVSLYILDEPSIGLHQRDHRQLLQTLLRLRDMGNTVVVVEHDAETMRAADYVLDLGPGAGVEGGKLVAHGPPSVVMADPTSLTGQYLNGSRRVALPLRQRKPKGFL